MSSWQDKAIKALEDSLIKMKDPETESKRYTSYIPYYG